MSDNSPSLSSSARSNRNDTVNDPLPEANRLRFAPASGASTVRVTSGFGGLTRVVELPGESARPYGGWFDTVVDVLEELITDAGMKIGEVIERVVVDRDELTIFISREHILQVCRFLRDDQDLRFELCLGVSGVHYPEDVGRELHAVYHLMSVTHNRICALR